MLRIEQISVGKDSPIFCRAHVEQENVWNKQNGKQEGAVDDTIFLQYPSAEETVIKWKEGMAVAKGIARSLQMSPGDTDDDTDWFESPHYSGCSKETDEWWDDDEENERNESTSEVDDEAEDETGDSNTDIDFHLGEACEEVDVGDIQELDEIVANLADESNETRNDSENDLQSTPSQVESAISPTVPIKDFSGNIYKSTLVSLLNQNPTLSKDRLLRVRNNTVEKTNSSQQYVPYLNMFDDVILIDKRKKCFNVGRVFRMRKKGKNNRRFEIKGFITEEELSQIIFNIQLYEEHRTNHYVVSTNVSEYSSSPSVVLNGKVNLCFNPDDETYELMDDVRDQIQTILTPKKVIEIPNASNSSNHSNDDVPDGIVIPRPPARHKYH